MDRSAWLDALGPMEHAPESIRAMLVSDGAVETLPAPRPHEWLAIHEEPGQTFDEFVRTATRAPAGERVIYLQPVDCLQPAGEVAALSDACLSTLAGFVSAFFQLDVRVRPPLLLDPATLVTRAAPDAGTPQVYAGDILARLFADKPSDAFCVLGLKAHALFPHPIVSFAFGEASAANPGNTPSLLQQFPLVGEILARFGDNAAAGQAALQSAVQNAMGEVFGATFLVAAIMVSFSLVTAAFLPRKHEESHLLDDATAAEVAPPGVLH